MDKKGQVTLCKQPPPANTLAGLNLQEIRLQDLRLPRLPPQQKDSQKIASVEKVVGIGSIAFLQKSITLEYTRMEDTTDPTE